jgi:hypothetical protein
MLFKKTKLTTIKLLSPQNHLSIIIGCCNSFCWHTYPSIEVIKSCKFLYVHKFVITLWLTWLKYNHIGYKCKKINTHGLDVLLLNDNILDLIMRSIFKSKYI